MKENAISETVENAATALGETVETAIESAIEETTERAEQAEELNAALVEAALEGERARRIDAIEKDLSECLQNQAAMGEAMVRLSSQMETLANLTQSALTQSRPMTEDQSPNPPSEDAGDLPSQPATATEPEAPPTEPESPPKRKKSRWI